MSASTAVTPFVFGGEHLVRVLTIDNAPWWFLKEICNVLGIGNHRMAAARLRENEKGVSLTDTLGGRQEAIVVNEPGLYRLVMRSKAPAAERFQDWVFHEVLPQIRKTGAYAPDGALTESEKLQKAQLLYSVAGKKGALPLLQEYGWLVEEKAPAKPSVEALVIGALRMGGCTIPEVMKAAGDRYARHDVCRCLEDLISSGRATQRGGVYALA